MSVQTSSATAWRCTNCGSVLGMRLASERLEIKHKEHAVKVLGPAQIVVPCRRCKTENTTTVRGDAAAA